MTNNDNFYSSIRRFGDFLGMTLKRVLELSILMRFLPETPNSPQVKDSAQTMKTLQQQAIEGNRDSMGELILLATMATNYFHQAARVQPAHARHFAKHMPAIPVCMFPQHGFNQSNRELICDLKVASKLRLSNKAMSALLDPNDRSASLAGLLQAHQQVRCAANTAVIEAVGTRPARHAFSESYPNLSDERKKLESSWGLRGGEGQAFLGRVWRWWSRNRWFAEKRPRR